MRKATEVQDNCKQFMLFGNFLLVCVYSAVLSYVDATQFIAVFFYIIYLAVCWLLFGMIRKMCESRRNEIDYESIRRTFLVTPIIVALMLFGQYNLTQNAVMLSAAQNSLLLFLGIVIPFDLPWHFRVKDYGLDYFFKLFHDIKFEIIVTVFIVFYYFVDDFRNLRLVQMIVSYQFMIIVTLVLFCLIMMVRIGINLKRVQRSKNHLPSYGKSYKG